MIGNERMTARVQSALQHFAETPFYKIPLATPIAINIKEKKIFSKNTPTYTNCTEISFLRNYYHHYCIRLFLCNKKKGEDFHSFVTFTTFSRASLRLFQTFPSTSERLHPVIRALVVTRPQFTLVHPSLSLHPFQHVPTPSVNHRDCLEIGLLFYFRKQFASVIKKFPRVHAHLSTPNSPSLRSFQHPFFTHRIFAAAVSRLFRLPLIEYAIKQILRVCKDKEIFLPSSPRPSLLARFECLLHLHRENFSCCFTGLKNCFFFRILPVSRDRKITKFY
mgnify:CR=1 FL=1